MKPITVKLVGLSTADTYRTEQDNVYIPADVFKEVVVDLRKGFHLFA